jgi:hypothetical protein
LVKEKEALPSSWIFSNDGINIFETSIDPAVKSGINLLRENPDFIKEMSSILKENNLNNLLSVAVLKRDSLQPKENDMYLEINSDFLNKSVVQVKNKDEIYLDTIRTTWSFGEPRQTGCHTMWVCGYSPGGGHDRYPSHRSF